MNFISAFLFLILAVSTTQAAQPMDVSELYRKVNEIRSNPSACASNEAANPLAPNRRLEEAARQRSAGKTLSDALNSTGYSAPYAKVIVVGGSTPQQTIERIMQRYCADIINPDFAEVGVVWEKNRFWMLLAYGERKVAPPEAVRRVAPVADSLQKEPMAFLALVNKARSVSRRCGDKQHQAAAPLKWHTMLAEAALAHARDISQGNFSHTGRDGSEVWERVGREGYSYRAVGENIAMNPMGIASTVDGWLNSPGHCANIMNPEFTEMGAAIQGSYSVMVFGRR